MYGYHQRQCLMCSFFYSVQRQTWTAWILQWAFPREHHAGTVLNLGQQFLKSWVSWVGGQLKAADGELDVKDMGLRRVSWHPQTSLHHGSPWIHASRPVCEALCVIQEEEYYVGLTIFKCDEFTSFNLIPWEDGTDSFSCVSLHRFYIEAVVLIRHVKGQLFAPYMVTQYSGVCAILCMLEPHAKAAKVCR